VRALIIAAHGSRKKESNKEVVSLTEHVAKKTMGSFEKVEHAFLQFCDPLLETKINELVKKGATDIVIFPFFIGSGNHILVDIPGLIKKAGLAHAHVKFKLTRHLGKLKAIEDVIIREVMACQ